MLEPVGSGIKGEFGRGRNKEPNWIWELCDRSVMGIRSCWTPRSSSGRVFKQFVPSSESLG